MGPNEDARVLTKKPNKDRELLIGLALLVVGLLIRLVHFNRSGLWMDECITAYRVMGFHSVFHQNDASPWFYPLVVYLFNQVLGPSELALRLPSLLSGVALGPVMFFMLRRRWPLLPSLVAGGLGTLNSINIYYSSEARVYAFAMLLCFSWTALLQEFLYLGPEEHPSKPAAVSFILLSPMVALSHHYCIYVGAAGFVVAVYKMSFDPVLRAKLWKIITAAYVLTLALWLPTLLGDTISNIDLQWAATKDNPNSPHTKPDAIIQFSMGMVLCPFVPIYILALSELIVGASSMSLAWGKRTEAAEWGWGAQYLLCVLFVIIGHLLVPSYMMARYDTVFFPLALVCIALAVNIMPTKSFRWFAVAFLLVFQSYNCTIVATDSMKNSTTTEMAEYIARENPDLVLATLPRDFDPLYLMPMAYYLHYKMGTNIPVMEIPRFKIVPDTFVTPTVHYVLYTQLLALPIDDTLAKLKETLLQHKKVVVIGEMPQLEKYASVLNLYRVQNSVVLTSLREKTTYVVTLVPRSPADLKGPGQK